MAPFPNRRSPRTPAEMPSGRPSSSGSRSASTVAWYGCRGACSNGCCRNGPRPSAALRRTTPSGPGSRASPSGSCAGAADRGRECGDQRAGFALGGRSRHQPGPPQTGAVDPQPPFVAGDEITRAAIDGPTNPLAAWAKVREAAFAPAEAIAAELRTAFRARSCYAGRPRMPSLRQALG